MSSTNAIETVELTKRYPQAGGLQRLWRGSRGQPAEAVRHVSLHVGEGELFGLLGPNGAGKTTLVKMLCTLILPTAGQARICNYDLGQSDRVRGLVGLSTGDERSFYWRLTGRQNLAFFAALCNLPSSHIKARVTQVLSQLGLSDVADTRVQTYSSGMRQRLSIGRALLHHPRILFLDEPTRSLDPTSTLQLHRLIQEELLAREGMTIFLTTHRLDEASKLCDRVGIMHKGQLRAVGTLAELRESLQARHRYHLTVQGLAPEQADDLYRTLPALQVQPAANGSLSLVLEPSAEDDLPAAISAVVSAGGRIQAVQRDDVSLEELFARFTHDDT